MTLWQGIILGLVQGLTEFLPVSSSGHLRVLEVATGVHTPGVFVEVTLHVATLGSVLVMYGSRLWAIARGVLARRPSAARPAAAPGRPARSPTVATRTSPIRSPGSRRGASPRRRRPG